MKIVAVDPRRVGIAGQADVLLQVRPGTDGALALALIDVVITDKLYDEAFVRQWTNGSFLVRADNGISFDGIGSDNGRIAAKIRRVGRNHRGSGCVRSFSGKF